MNEPVPGLMNASVGGYHIRDIEVSAAFDIHAGKVGKDVAAALWKLQTIRIVSPMSRRWE